MKKLTLILSMLIALIGFNANATMYLVGMPPLGQGWDPSKGVEMTDNNDGTYSYVATINGTVYFCFADALGANSDDWNTFNGNYRFGPSSGDQVVEAGNWTTTQRGSGAYMFSGTNEEYEITFDANQMKFMISGYVAPINPLTGHLYALGQVNGNNWNPSAGIEMTTTDGNIFTLTDAEITEGDDGYGFFSFTSKLGENANDWGFAPYRRGAAVDRTLVEDGVPAVLADWGSDGAFMIVPGIYDITVNLSGNSVTLVKKGETPPEPDPDVYILGEVNDNGGWAPNKGVQMTLNEGVYTADITTAGENNGLSYFSFTKQLAENADDWDAIAPYRFGAVSEGDFLMTEELLGVPCDLTANNGQAIAVPAGEWTVTVNLSTNKFTVNGTWPTDTVTPEPAADVFIIGDVNNFSTAEGWVPTKGAQMTLADSVYTATVNATLREGQEYAYFGFSKKIADEESETPWDDIEAYRFGPVSEGDFLMTEELLGVECALATDGSHNSIAIPEGEWTVTVNLNTNKFTINGTWPTDTVTPEPTTDLYIIGEVNDNGGWFTNKGVKMTLNEGVYTADITTAGENEGISYFSFTKQLADSAADWDAIAPYRIGAVSEGDFLMTEELLGVECALTDNGQAIAVPAGEWTVTVNLETYKFTITGEWPTDTVTPEPEANLYIIGEVNDNGGWFTNKGVLMTLNEGVYTADITTAGENDGLSYFSFTKQLADSAADWDAIAPYRIGAVSDGDFLMTQELLGVECALTDNGQAIALPAGEWTVTVNLETYKFTITGEWPEVPGPEPYDGDVYILGEVNDNGGWFTNKGVLMTRDTEHNLYTATITTAGENVPEGEEAGYSYFSFTKQLADSAADWDAIAPYRFGAVSEGDYWVTDETLGTEIALTNNGQSFRVPAGTWDLTLSVDNMTLVINKKTFELGDVNHDGYVDIADVTALISIVLKKANYPAEADVNSDGEATIADVTILIGRVLAGHW